jgi:HAD superfamily hydrolase (TIGR01549 family)
VSAWRLAERRRAIRGVVFDVDGTLYHQAPLRALMMAELTTLPLTERSWRGARQVWRTLAVFRAVRENLRGLGRPDTLLAEVQFQEAARLAGVDARKLERLVTEWILVRPLKYLRACRRRGAARVLQMLVRRGISLGTFSDYPVAEKLVALGLPEAGAVSVCATDPEVNAFKPHPAGFLRACQLMGLPPSDVLYVGDRPEVDAAGAAIAGMPCAIVGERRSSSGGDTRWLHLRSLEELSHAFGR